MSDILSQIENELHVFSTKRGPAVLMQVKVIAVDETTATVTVQLEDGGEIDDVQLRSVVNDAKRVVTIPKVNTVVLIASILSSDEYYVVAVDEVEKIIVEIGSLSIEISDKIKVVKGANDLKQGLIKIIEAVEQVVVLQGNNPNYIKLTQAKQIVNNLFD